MRSIRSLLRRTAAAPTSRITTPPKESAPAPEPSPVKVLDVNETVPVDGAEDLRNFDNAACERAIGQAFLAGQCAVMIALGAKYRSMEQTALRMIVAHGGGPDHPERLYKLDTTAMTITRIR